MQEDKVMYVLLRHLKLNNSRLLLREISRDQLAKPEKLCSYPEMTSK